ncbi:hypothetical protein BSLG_006609 [Batrachochytrium salamandrivorans]|nr:hypothetical protein BSLG_006609 [Batrachochytrium salamandrivorans]
MGSPSDSEFTVDLNGFGDVPQYYLSMISIAFVLPCFMYGCYTIATAPPPSRTIAPCWVKRKYAAEAAEKDAIINGVDFSVASQVGLHTVRKPKAAYIPSPSPAPPPSVGGDTIQAESKSSKSGLSEQDVQINKGWLLKKGASSNQADADKCKPIKGFAHLPFSERFLRRCIFVLSPNAIIWFLNLAFGSAQLVLCTVSLAHWSIAFNNKFDIYQSVIDWNTLPLVEVIHTLQHITQSVYFIAIWTKHRLVRLLPGASSGFIVWGTSIFISMVAIVPSIPQLAPALRVEPETLENAAILMLAFCMSILAWIYVYLSIRNIKAATLSYTHTLHIIKSNRLLNWWLIIRPLILVGTIFIPLSFILISGKELDLSAYAAFIIVADFLFEYQQIQRGLFGILVREISLPPNVRRKLDQTVSPGDSYINDADWGDNLDDCPQDFEFESGQREFTHYDFGEEGGGDIESGTDQGIVYRVFRVFL